MNEPKRSGEPIPAADMLLLLFLSSLSVWWAVVAAAARLLYQILWTAFIG